MHITRILEKKLAAKVDWKKALILLGPRQVGKSTLVNKLAGDLDPDFLLLNSNGILKPKEKYQSHLLKPTIPKP